jgi:hypothetical protein
VRTGLVTHPVTIGIPEWSSVEGHYLPTAPSQPLGKDPAAGTAPDDNQVHFFFVAEPPHFGT